MPFNKPSMIWVMETIIGGARQNRVQYTVTLSSFLGGVMGFLGIDTASPDAGPAHRERFAGNR